MGFGGLNKIVFHGIEEPGFPRNWCAA